MVGHAGAFLNLIRSAAPALCQAFASSENIGVEQERSIVRAIYEQIPALDFSRCVLSSAPRALGVFGLGDVGWSDLGDPQRLVEAMAQKGERSEWLDAWRRQAM
jgi:mannose-1-phosphate guanylyltransferase